MFPVAFRDRFSTPSPTVAVVLTVLVGAQVGLLAVYLFSFGVSLRPFHLYPVIWITIGMWVLWRVRPIAAEPNRRLLAAAVAGGYFLLLAYIGGLFGTGIELPGRSAFGGDEAAFLYGLDVVTTVPPGYGPALLYAGPYLTLALVPYLLVGYLALAYLVYVTFLDAAGASAPGVLGVFACIGCSWPLLAGLVTGAGGAAGLLAGTMYSFAYPLSTLAFLLAVGLLYWRPGFDGR